MLQFTPEIGNCHSVCSLCVYFSLDYIFFTSLNEIVQHMKGIKDSKGFLALFCIEKGLLTNMSIIGGCEDVGTVRCDGVYCRIVS